MLHFLGDVVLHDPVAGRVLVILIWLRPRLILSSFWAQFCLDGSSPSSSVYHCNVFDRTVFLFVYTVVPIRTKIKAIPSYLFLLVIYFQGHKTLVG